MDLAVPQDVFIVGVGRTRFGRDPGVTVRDMTAQAVSAALEDAGLSSKDLSAAFFANAGQGAMEGQHMVRGHIALRHAEIEQIPIINVESACASASAALKLAVNTIRAGDADVVLAAGAERLSVGDSERSRDFFAGAMDVGQATPRFEELTGLEFSPDGTSGRDRSVFMDYYARLARDHMARYGTTQRQLACVTAKNRGHAALNSNAQYQQPMTADEVLAAREIVWPLTLPMCAPIGNGAAAAVVCSADFLQGRSRARAVRIAALCLGSGAVRTHDDTAPALTRRLARQAYRLAGMSPSDVSLAEVHDASAIGEILQTEALGFVEDGEGGRAAEAGVTALGGRIPVNTSGGLECNGHPIGATGLAQVYEIVAQLRHEAGARQVEGARIGLTETAGGFVGDEDASACVGIFERLSA